MWLSDQWTISGATRIHQQPCRFNFVLMVIVVVTIQSRVPLSVRVPMEGKELFVEHVTKATNRTLSVEIAYQRDNSVIGQCL